MCVTFSIYDLRSQIQSSNDFTVSFDLQDIKSDSSYIQIKSYDEENPSSMLKPTEFEILVHSIMNEEILKASDMRQKIKLHLQKMPQVIV